MEKYLLKKHCQFNRKISILILVLLISLLFSNVDAKHVEFESNEFQENLTLTAGGVNTINFSFQKGEIIEVIYLLQVKPELPVNAWLVNGDNYLLLTGGAQFLFFIDGSVDQVTYAKRIAALTKHDEYKLTVMNYNNRTVEVNITGEVREFRESSNEVQDSPKEVEDSSDNPNPFLIYILILIIIILIIIICFGIGIYKLKGIDNKQKNMNLGMKSKKQKDKKIKKAKPESKKKTKKTRSVSSEFCGYCGKSVDTPYCKFCGEKN
jgi:acylphosphatase